MKAESNVSEPKANTMARRQIGNYLVGVCPLQNIMNVLVYRPVFNCCLLVRYLSKASNYFIIVGSLFRDFVIARLFNGTNN